VRRKIVSVMAISPVEAVVWLQNHSVPIVAS
jgi:hypothetical protein